MRLEWDAYFMKLAELASERATCSRAKVGCVLVRDRDVIATRYNGSISGEPHCDDVGHDMVESHCVRTVHAEANALCMAARNGHSTKGSTAYITHNPCWVCYKLLVQAGIVRVVYGCEYRMDERVRSLGNVLLLRFVAK